MVLPKLREENERLWMRKKSKPVKDVISEGTAAVIPITFTMFPRLTDIVDADEFEVAIFLRESRTRHSLLTRQKTFHGHADQRGTVAAVESENGLVESAAEAADAEVIIESDEEPELDLNNIPQAAAGDQEPPKSNTWSRRGKREAIQAEAEEAGADEKKLRFSTHYESFNICGWVLCLLITRKGDRAGPNKQPLMEEWISTQAQTAVGED